VLAVDVGNLMLTGYKIPDLLEYFFAERYHQVQSCDMLNRYFSLLKSKRMEAADMKTLGATRGAPSPSAPAAKARMKKSASMEMADEEMAKEAPAESGPETALRTVFKTCAYFNPGAVTDRNGKARVSFKLPDNLTAFRIYAVAHTNRSQFGQGETEITVSKDFLIRPALPRFARIGDSIALSAIAHNNTGKDAKAKVKAEVNGKALPRSKKGKIEAKGHREDIFGFNVASLKPLDIIFKGSMGKFGDAVLTKIPVLAHRTFETVALSGNTTDKHTESVRIPKDIYTDVGGITFSAASTALIDLGEGLKYLFEYPYGCLEQKTSRVLPIVLFSDVVKDFGLKGLEKGDEDRVIQNYLDTLKHYVRSSGAFSVWPHGRYDSPYVTVYAVFCMQRAQERGFKIDKGIYRKALNFLKKYVSKAYKKDKKYGYPWSYYACVSGLALEVLAHAKKAKKKWFKAHMKNHARMPLFGKAALMRAMHKQGGFKDEVAFLRKRVNNGLRMESGTAHFEEGRDDDYYWYYHSNVKLTSACLLTFLEVDGGHPKAGKMVKWILRERKMNRWHSTQENVYAFWALASYYRTYEKEEPDFTAIIKFNTQQVLKEIFKGRSRDVKSATVGFEQYEPDGLLKTEYIKKGPGRLYYTTTMKYAPKGHLKPMNRGFLVTKTITDMKGKKVEQDYYKTGETYRVTLTMKTRTRRLFVAVNDPLPAGFEIVQTAFKTEASKYSGHEGGGYSGHGYWWWYTPFDFIEKRDDKILLFVDRLYKGEISYTYLVRATAAGRFNMPPTHMEEMYTPEVFGRTGSQVIWVGK
jgi:uncharacterized protein YfaS (alpha-2-macroglobulin family)